jgi:hypothetical protein
MAAEPFQVATSTQRFAKARERRDDQGIQKQTTANNSEGSSRTAFKTGTGDSLGPPADRPGLGVPCPHGNRGNICLWHWVWSRQDITGAWVQFPPIAFRAGLSQKVPVGTKGRFPKN